MKSLFPVSRRFAAALLTLMLSACGGSGGSDASLGGTVTGLTTGSLELTNGSSLVTLTPTTPTFTFPTRVPLNSTYGVGIRSSTTPLSCTITNALGIITADVNTIQVTCVSNNTVGGTVTGLTAGTLVLANGSDTVTLAANATTFTFPAKVPDGSPYGITVLTQPAGLTCSVANGVARMGSTDVTNVQVTCVKS